MKDKNSNNQKNANQPTTVIVADSTLNLVGIDAAKAELEAVLAKFAALGMTNIAAEVTREKSREESLTAIDIQIAPIKDKLAAIEQEMNEALAPFKARHDAINAELVPLLAKRNAILGRKSNGEGTRTCGACGATGHNARTCSVAKTANEIVPAN